MAADWTQVKLMDAKHRDALAAKYEAVSAAVREAYSRGADVPPGLKTEQERLRRQLDALLED